MSITTYIKSIKQGESYTHHSSIIADNVTIEDGVYIGPLCIIGAPAEWKGKESSQGVIIRSGAVITGLVTIDAGAEQPTEIGSGAYIMKHAHIGHDARIGKNVVISCGAKIGGHAIIEEDTTIGLNAVIHQRVTVPAGCMIGASAFIGKKTDLKPHKKYAGVPAKEIGDNIKP